ncbi:MAG TPA: hypothetical protein VII01_12520 [Solirubrobacteraceae bacterium]
MHPTRWERSVYTTFSQALESAGATTLAFNGHMELTEAVLARARAIDPELALKAARASAPAPDDRALSAATIEQVRLTLSEEPRQAVLTNPNAAEIVALVEERQRIDDVPCLVACARLPRRLLESYRWDAAGRDRLAETATPVVAVRLIDAGETQTAIVHAQLTRPSGLQDVLTEWASRGPSLVIAAASCFVDTVWASEWSQALRAADALIVLVDVEADRFVASWVRSQIPVRAGTVRVEDTSGVFWATGLQVGEDSALWLHLGDEVTVKLMLDQLRHTPGLDLREDASHLRAWSRRLQIAITHVLATESFLDLQGLDSDTIRRVTAL